SVAVFEPVIPPAYGLLKEADRGFRHPVLRIDVPPGTDDPKPRNLQPLEQPRNGVGVTVGPAPDCEHWALDGREILTDGAVLPVVVIALMGEPERREKRNCGDPLEPALAPARADDLGVERARLEGQHDAAPPEIVVEDAAAHVVDVVGITVVGRADRDDRLERGR